MKKLNDLTKQVLSHRLNKGNECSDDVFLVQQFFSLDTLYVVADPNTLPGDWERREFAIVIESKSIALYSDYETAALHAKKIGSMLLSGKEMVMKVSSTMAKALISDYSQKQFIQSVNLFGRGPIMTSVRIDAFQQNTHIESPSTVMRDEEHQIPLDNTANKNTSTAAVCLDTKKSNGLLLINEIIVVLDTPSAESRRHADPGKNYEDFHKLVEKIIQANGIAPSDMDSYLGLQEGYTAQLCTNLVNSNTPKSIVKDYLSYFGLSEYLYVFRKQCDEVNTEIIESSVLDQYEIRPATVKTQERFTLVNRTRGQDNNGAYVYRIKFKSKYREITTVCSSLFGMIEGKEYAIDGLSPVKDTGASNITGSLTEPQASVIPSKEEEAETLKAIEEKSAQKKQPKPSQQHIVDDRAKGKNRYVDETEEDRLERDKNEIIGELIKSRGCNSQDAKRLLEPLLGHPDIIASYAKYIRDGKPGKYALRGYTPKKLMNELHYSTYEAYCMLAQLETAPKETLQRLKYRECDPQYQKKPTRENESSERKRKK